MAAPRRVFELDRPGLLASAATHFKADGVLTRDNYYYLATVHLLLGNLDQAVESVDRYLTEQKEWTAAFIRVDPIMEPLRELPEFQAVLENHSN